MCQVLIVSALWLKIQHVEDYFNQKRQDAEILTRIVKADKRAKWLYVIISVFVIATATLFLCLSFPIGKVLDQDGYNVCYMCQLSITMVFLSLMLILLARKIKSLERKS